MASSSEAPIHLLGKRDFSAKFVMKTAFVLSAFAIAGIYAQDEAPGAAKGPPPKGPSKDGGKGGAKGGNSGIMSALGSMYNENGVPLGPAPKGCSTYEVIIGLFVYCFKSE